MYNNDGNGGGRGGYGGGGGYGPREEHAIKCSQCGKDSTVPFKPIGDRPVYCKDCFRQMRDERGDSRGGFRGR
ncbi:hypothetical protein KGQ34_01760 [Patescibacteria group bacterium]|nr:hypothetical protein [Patescibacteria group bacterium]